MLTFISSIISRDDGSLLLLEESGLGLVLLEQVRVVLVRVLEVVVDVLDRFAALRTRLVDVEVDVLEVLLVDPLVVAGELTAGLVAEVPPLLLVHPLDVHLGLELALETSKLIGREFTVCNLIGRGTFIDQSDWMICYMKLTLNPVLPQ